jgi:membrane-bound serine protease (ClpP class)
MSRLGGRVPVALVCLVLGASARAEIPVVELEGIVHAISAGHVVRAIDAADASRAPLLVLRLDTPGGLDTSMRQIIEKMLNCRTPIAVFVGPSGARAASAGFLITIAADVAAMAPGTNIGAAHPVSVTGQMDETMSKKAASDAAAYIRGKAARRGRNVEMAEKAVLESKSFTEKEALDAKLIDLIVNDVPELLRVLEGREITRFDGSKVTLRLLGEDTRPVTMSWRQAILSTIARPEVLFLLLLGALAGLGAEISHPGLLFPGILGAVCLVLFLFASQIIPVNGAGVLLILLAIVLFVVEVKVASHGLLAVGGIASLILGAMMLIDSPLPEMRISLETLLPAAIFMALATMTLVRMVIQAQRRKPSTGGEGLVGQHAVALSDLTPEGWVRVQGERWRAVADEPVGTGDGVVVAGISGLTLKVRKGE